MNSKKDKWHLATKDITLVALLTTLLFVQEQALVFIPNVQLTVFLIVLYSKKLGFLRTSLIVAIYVVLDNLVMGSFNLIYTPFMFIGWFLIPLLMCTIFRKVESNIALAFLGILFSLLYSWIFIIPNCIVLSVSFLSYLVADLLFEIILSLSSFLSILLLYNPLSKVLDRIIPDYLLKNRRPHL